MTITSARSSSSSPDSIEDAIKSAIARAGSTLRNLRWFEVVETRGHIENGEIHHEQITLKVGFSLEDGAGSSEHAGS